MCTVDKSDLLPEILQLISSLPAEMIVGLLCSLAGDLQDHHALDDRDARQVVALLDLALPRLPRTPPH